MIPEGLCAQDGVHTSTLTFGVWGETPTYNLFGESTGSVFNGNYEYRILKYLAVEGGFESMLPLTTTYKSVPVFIPPNYAGDAHTVRHWLRLPDSVEPDTDEPGPVRRQIRSAASLRSRRVVRRLLHRSQMRPRVEQSRRVRRAGRLCQLITSRVHLLQSWKTR